MISSLLYLSWFPLNFLCELRKQFARNVFARNVFSACAFYCRYICNSLRNYFFRWKLKCFNILREKTPTTETENKPIVFRFRFLDYFSRIFLNRNLKDIIKFRKWFLNVNAKIKSLPITVNIILFVQEMLTNFENVNNVLHHTLVAMTTYAYNNF